MIFLFKAKDTAVNRELKEEDHDIVHKVKPRSFFYSVFPRL